MSDGALEDRGRSLARRGTALPDRRSTRTRGRAVASVLLTVFSRARRLFPRARPARARPRRPGHGHGAAVALDQIFTAEGALGIRHDRTILANRMHFDLDQWSPRPLTSTLSWLAARYAARPSMPA